MCFLFFPWSEDSLPSRRLPKFVRNVKTRSHARNFVQVTCWLLLLPFFVRFHSVIFPSHFPPVLNKAWSAHLSDIFGERFVLALLFLRERVISFAFQTGKVGTSHFSHGERELSSRIRCAMVWHLAIKTFNMRISGRIIDFRNELKIKWTEAKWHGWSNPISYYLFSHVSL